MVNYFDEPRRLFISQDQKAIAILDAVLDVRAPGVGTSMLVMFRKLMARDLKRWQRFPDISFLEGIETLMFTALVSLLQFFDFIRRGCNGSQT